MATGKRWTDIPAVTDVNETDLVRVNQNPEDKVITIAELRTALLGDGTWQQPLILGTNFLWIDTSGDLRVSNATPASDTDGTVVGTQA